MRWLLLIIIVACGKHKTPRALDLNDNDGDQVVNELDEDKDLANIHALAPMKGALRYQHQNRNFEIGFATLRDLKTDSLSLLARAGIKKEEHFSEWSKLRLETVGEASLSGSKLFDVKLMFESSEGQASNVVIKIGNNVRILKEWKENMVIQMGRQELECVLKDKCHLGLIPKGWKAAGPIKDRTARVFFFDGERASVLYVSKKLKWEDFLERFSVHDPQTVQKESLFSPRDGQGPQWWTKDLGDGDKVLAYVPFDLLRIHFLKGLSESRSSIQRENGMSKKILRIEKNKNGRAYLFLRPKRTLRAFVSRKKEFTRQDGGGGREGNGSERYKCQNWIREIESEHEDTPDLNYLLSNLKIAADQRPVDLENIQEGQDEKGPFWMLTLGTGSSEVVFSLIDMPKNDLVITGIYRSSCQDPVESTPNTHPEAKFILETKAFIENLP